MESKTRPRMDCFQYYCTGNHTPMSGDKSMPQTSHPSITATSSSFFVQMSLLAPGLKFKLKHLLHTKQSLGVVLTIQFSHSLACFALWQYICEAWQWLVSCPAPPRKRKEGLVLWMTFLVTWGGVKWRKECNYSPMHCVQRVRWYQAVPFVRLLCQCPTASLPWSSICL